LLGEWSGSEGQRPSRPVESPPRSLSTEALLALWILIENLSSSTLGEVGVPTYQDDSASMPQIWEFTYHSKLSNHFSYVICAFTYRMVESDVLLLYIWSHA
jgi:hypothetical protein